MDNAIEIRGLTKKFYPFQLGPIDLTVPAGAIYGYIGANGSGKTVTLDMIMGMGRNDAGAITVFGLDHRRGEAAMKAHIGYVSPDLNFNAFGKVNTVVNFYRGFFPGWDDTYCQDLARRLNIGFGEKISTLSFGARTKLGLLLALSHRPKLLLLDEPLAGVDAISKQEIFTELLDAVQEEERTVFITSHNLDAIERFADHIGILHDGKLLLEGPADDLLDRYCIVDCTSNNGARPEQLPGIRVQQEEGPRFRLLADRNESGFDRLTEHGFTDISTTPITLEELFVALVREA